LSGLGVLPVSALADTPGGAAPVTVELQVSAEGKFEVLHSRAKSTATGAALFGLIGAGIEEGNRAGKDKKREEEIIPLLEDTTCSPVLINAMAERLSEKGFKLHAPDAGIQAVGEIQNILHLKIVACGFKMVDSGTEDMAAFVAAKYYVIEPKQKKPKKMSPLLIFGKTRSIWEAILSNPESANAEFAAVKVKAGRRLANKIIYNNR